MMLVFMDLAPGSLRLEEVAEARTYATWQARVDERLKVRSPWGLSLGSDRAKTPLQLAAQGAAWLSIPDPGKRQLIAAQLQLALDTLCRTEYGRATRGSSASKWLRESGRGR
jgi:hypothetical protein